MQRLRFIGYPSDPAQVGESIEQAERSFRLKIADHTIKTWRQVFQYGEIIDKNIFETIDKSECCYFDLSVPNFNVMYEAGYAIGRGKPVIPIINTTIDAHGSYLQNIGIFDTVAICYYANSQDLLILFQRDEIPRPIHASLSSVNNAQPIYVIKPKILDERFAKIFSTLNESGVNYRQFEPSDDPRMSVRDVVNEVTQSTAVVCGVASPSMTDAEANNLRAAFVAGLAAGSDRDSLVLNMSGSPLPLDLRDFGKDASSLEKISAATNSIAMSALRALQNADFNSPTAGSLSSVDWINLGSSAAENEVRRLPDYFIQTSAYNQTVAGQARIVIGRKGSGKTAIFSMAKLALAQGRKSIVLALKPDGYQLRKFKDQLICLLKDGTKEHTVACLLGLPSSSRDLQCMHT